MLVSLFIMLPDAVTHHLLKLFRMAYSFATLAFAEIQGFATDLLVKCVSRTVVICTVL